MERIVESIKKDLQVFLVQTKTVCVLCPQVWQYVTLMNNIYLIDCPGIVYPTGATTTDLVLKGVVSAALFIVLNLSMLNILLHLVNEYSQY